VPSLTRGQVCHLYMLLTLASADPCAKVKVTLRPTVGQSVSLGVEPYLGLMTRYLVLFDGYGLVFFLWGALSDERTGLSVVRVIACISKSFVIL
jgi:hypothetical protein